MEKNQQNANNQDPITVLFARQAAELLKQAQPEEAVRLCEQGVKAFPAYAEGHHVLARAYQSLKRYKEARAEYERTLFFMPNHLQAQKGLAYVYYKEKNREKGNEVIINHALYNPLDTELNEFLKTEGLYLQLYRKPEPFLVSEETASAPQPQEASEEEVTLPEEEHELIDEQLFKEEPEPESSAAEIAASAEPSIPAAEQEAVVPEEEMFEGGGEDELASSGEPLPLGEEDLIEMPIEGVDEDRQEMERGTILEELSESAEETSKGGEPPSIDLDQFKNTEDDFSTLMGEMFEGGEEASSEPEPAEESSGSEQIAEEPETPALEKPILDTTVIFNENRQAAEETEEEPKTEEAPVAFAQDLEQALDLSETEQELIEEEIEKVTEPELSEEPPAVIEEELLAEEAAAPEEAQEILPIAEEGEAEQKSEEINPTEPAEETEQLLEKMEASLEEKGKEKSYQEETPLKAIDEESVNIEEILENPSLLTPTFGEILIAQKKFEDARRVFQELQNRQPDNPKFKKKLEFLDKIIAFQK